MTGSFLVLLALIVTLGSLGWAHAPGTVLDARCDDKRQLGVGKPETRCAIDVEFVAHDGTTVRATLRDAYVEEIYELERRRLVDVTYDPDNPHDAEAKSVEMPGWVAIGLVLGGLAAAAFGVFVVRAARRGRNGPA